MEQEIECVTKKKKKEWIRLKVEREERERGEDNNGKGGKVADTWSPSGPPPGNRRSRFFLEIKEIKEFQC